MSTKLVLTDALRALTPVQEVTVHNATDEWLELAYDGETRQVPPHDQTIPPALSERYRGASATDTEGNLIPGTLVIRDVYDEKAMGEFGSLRNAWSAADAVKHCLGLNIRSGVAEGPLAARGMSILPPNPTPETVAQVAAAGRARYEVWRLDQARKTVEALDDKNAARARVNMAAVPPGEEYYRAKTVLEVHDELLRERVKASVRGTREAAPEVVEEEATTEDLEAYIRARLAEPPVPTLAEADPKVVAEARVRDLLADPRAMRLLREQYKVHKRPGKKE